MPKVKTVDVPASEDQDIELASDSVKTQPVGLSFAELYVKAQAPFDKTYQRQIPGGRSLTYITGEQVVSRMNEVFGPFWEWKPEDPHIVGDEVYLRGTLSVTTHGESGEDSWGTTIVRSAFGGATIKRRRDGAVLSLGNDIKAADTDAFKKAAAKFGVGLYLYERTGEDELPSYDNPVSAPVAGRPAPSNLNAVTFPGNNSNGTQTVGVIRAKSANGINVNDQWYNTSKYNPIDLSPYQKGQTVVITHATGKTFIDGLQSVATTVGGAAEEEEVATF